MTSHERSATRKHSMDGLPCGQLHEMLKCQPCPQNGQSSRPSMAYSLTRRKKDVDARDKRGHDGEGAIPCHRDER
jgi:hypothetical protein